MSYTQQQIVQLYRQLLPQIKETSNKVEISLKGKVIVFDKPASDRSEKTANRIVSFR